MKASGGPSEISDQDAVPPLVVVEGFMSSIGVMWGKYAHYLNWNVPSTTPGSSQPRRTILTSVGPVSSLHDRACELYYALKGGTVDYGEEHSKQHKHGRFGRTHAKGLYPQWSKQTPAHFLGHSIGGATIMKLQHLISQGYFSPDDHPDMIQSVTAVSTPFRGTQLVYSLGERTDAAPAVRFLSLGSLLSKGVHIAAYFAPFLPISIDLHVESRSLSCRDSSVFHLLKQLWKSDWAESEDCTPYDVTFAAAGEREAHSEGRLNANTFYRSYVACMTNRVETGNHHSPRSSHLVSPTLYMSSRAMGRFDFSGLRPVPDFIAPCHENQPSTPVQLQSPKELEEQPLTTKDNPLLGEEYWANDGVVPLFSQWHPYSCNETQCTHMGRALNSHSVKPTPGIWHVYEFEDENHTSILPVWIGSQRQKTFWGDLGDWLNAIDKFRAKQADRR